MFGLIGLVVLLVVSIVLAIFANRYWHWAHVMVVFGLVFSTVLFANLAYRVLNLRTKPQLAEKQAAEQLDKQLELIDAIERGTEDRGMVSQLSEPLGLDEDASKIASIGDMEHALRMVSRERGRLWDNVRAMGQPNPQTLQVDVVVAEDAPPINLSQGAILYAFEQGEPINGAAYLGEFRVVQAQPRQLRLEPVLSMYPEDLRRYAASAADGRLWTLHESMPVDSHELFDGLSDEQLQAMLPESTVEEYLRDGTPFESDDDLFRKMGLSEDGRLLGPEDAGKAVREIYSRKLRDYAYLFQEHAQRQAELRAEGAALTSNKQKIEDALSGAKQLLAERQETQQKLKRDLAGAKRDQQTVEAHLAELQKQLKIAQELLNQTLAANVRTADDLSALQAAWAGQADLSTTPVPASPAGDPHAL